MDQQELAFRRAKIGARVLLATSQSPVNEYTQKVRELAFARVYEYLAAPGLCCVLPVQQEVDFSDT